MVVTDNISRGMNNDQKTVVQLAENIGKRFYH
jgi:hypothetical protein